MKNKEIKISITLDDKSVPEHIVWEATDSDESSTPCKALILSMWDSRNDKSMRLDLWTKEMPVDDMKKFYYETLITMADSYERATNDEKNASEIKDFAIKLGQKMEILKIKDS